MASSKSNQTLGRLFWNTCSFKSYQERTTVLPKVYWTPHSRCCGNCCYSPDRGSSRGGTASNHKNNHIWTAGVPKCKFCLGSQTHIDQEITERLVDLENATLLPGDKVQILQLQIHLKCDWNTSSFCVTPHKYNQSAYTWDQLSKHLRGHVHNNLSLGISQLQATVSNMQKAHLQ